MNDFPLSNGRTYRDGLIFDFKPTDRSGATLYPIPTGRLQFPREEFAHRPPLDQLAQTFMRLLNAHGWAPPDDPFNTADWYTPEPCPHDSLSGDEGPVILLGRWPVRWRCDECGAIIHTHQGGPVSALDDLHERIAEAVHGLSVEAPIGVLNGRDSRAVADAVIRELGLRQETRGHTHVAISGPIITERFRRYVTDWTTDEGSHP